jgi:uncharacterized protein (DUF924 family)
MQGGFEEVLNFWFGQPDDPSYGKSRSFWFSPSPAFDRQVRSRFLPTYQQAARGEFNSWQDSALICCSQVSSIYQIFHLLGVINTGTLVSNFNVACRR